MKTRSLARKLTGTALLACLLLAMINPRYERQSLQLRARFVIDITQSMNTRDYGIAGAPADRLGYSRWVLGQVFPRLPCGSEIALGVFSHHAVEWLFAPIEVCEHLDVIQDVLGHIDWRMAWAADSHIAQGIQAAIREIDHMQESSALVFMTDGQETPEAPPETALTTAMTPHHGLLLGVGKTSPSPVPLLDRNNVHQGFWENGDLDLPDPHALYMSWLHETELRSIANLTGMQYARLTDPESLLTALEHPELQTTVHGSGNTRWIFLLAGVILSALLPWIT